MPFLTASKRINHLATKGQSRPEVWRLESTDKETEEKEIS